MKKTSLLLVLFLTTVFPGFSINQVTDSLELLLNSAKDTSKVKILCDLCWEYRFVSSKKAVQYGEEALALSKEINWEKGLAQSYNDLGIIFIDKSDFGKAIDYFEKSLEIRKKLNDNIGVASAYNKLGIVRQKQGNLKQALENQVEALKIYEELDQERWIAYSLNNIAIIHQNLGNLQNSLEYHQKAVQYQLQLDDKYGEGMSYGNIGNVYIKLKDTIQAIQFYKKALLIFREIGNKEAIAVELSNLGDIFLNQGKNVEAIKLLNESLDIRNEIGDQKGISSCLLKLGECYTNLNDFRKAKNFLFKGLRLARKVNVVDEEIEAYLNLAKMYALQNKIDSAFAFTRKYISLKDSVYDQRLKQQIVDVQIRYETEKIEQENALLQSENELIEATLKQRKTEILLLVFVIISIAGASIFLLYRRKQKQKEALDAAIIKHNEQQLQAVIDGQEEERRRIARELHDGVGQKLAGIKINWENIAEELNKKSAVEQAAKIATMLDSAASEVRNISHQMMPKELEQFGLIPAVESVLRNNLDNTKIRFEFNHLGLDNRLPKLLELNLFRIIQELVSNVIRHADADKLDVQVLKRQDSVVLIVEDDGKGFETSNNESFGIGLMNIESRVKMIKASLDIESEPGKGTTIRIRTPLNE